MKKCLLISALTLSIFSAKANQDSVTVELGEVVISENRIEIPFNKTSRNISIISRKDIETTPARSLQEVLAFTPGVDVRQRGVTGVQGDIGIRGGGFEQTLMLINGIKMTDPQTGHHIMNIPIPLQAIQRVEVMKGPASRIFGQNAYAGAVNIVTTLPETASLNIQNYGGDFGMKGASIVSSLPVKLPFGLYKQTLSVSHDASNGHWYNSDYKVNNVFYEGGLDINDQHEIRTMIGYTERDFGANGFYTNSFPDQWESIQTFLASLSHTFEKKQLYIQTRAYWRKNDDEFRLRRNEPAFFTNLHTSHTTALEINSRYQSQFGTSGFGVEGRNEKINSTNLGNRQRTFLGVFAEHRIEFWEDFDFRAGVYSNYYDEYGWKHFPGAELGYQINNSSRLYTNYGASYRIPSFTDLYYQDPSNLANPNLVPEEAQSFEIGYKFQKNGLRAELVYFNRYSKNLIDWYREPSTVSPNPNRWTPRNISEVTFQGIETGIQYAFGASSKNIKLKEATLSYNFIDANLMQNSGVESRNTLSALRHQLIGGIKTEWFNDFEMNVKARYLERMALDPYFLLDVRVDYKRLKTFGLFAEASNVTNSDYIEAGFVQMPGRWFRAGINLNLVR
ncbi:TonB-dependent receptor plug domain-containing protein [Belliella kenyensis]|uniref:TonB-dependent receptor plug domain-containing protein n=1 Tax=Belliella kenyensis TaxID=1472724 RepID=A0ABV8EKT5_9BACT|nr:TonB-dependent receptor [Belliella kenyensis]MCH7403158.1 TonB-dependent receptor [Belliella kenyensis]MDN3602327.1 TonB-dependent receptor [Belliella kenyensis]